MGDINPLYILLFLISPLGLVFWWLILWALLFAIGYSISPFAFSRSSSYKLTVPYRIFQGLRAGDRRSRAVFCLAYTFPMAFAAWCFLELLLFITWGTPGFNVGIVAFAVVFFLLMAISVLSRDFLLNKLISAGMIKMNEAA